MDLNSFYIGVSGWQKAIRRSDLETAKRMLAVATAGADTELLNKLYRRVYTVLYEDVGLGDTDGLREVGRRLTTLAPKEVYKSPKELLWLTEVLCAMTKNREGASAQDVFKGLARDREGDGCEPRRMRDMRDMLDLHQFGAAGWRLYLQDKELYWSTLRKLTPSTRRDLIYFGAKAWSRGSEYAWGVTALLPFDLPTEPLKEALEKTKFYKGFPGYAIDMHTKLGKKVIGLVAKKLEVSYDEVAGAMWENEGRLLKPATQYPKIHFASKRRAERKELFKRAQEFLHLGRSWVMEKHYQGPEA